MKIINKQERQDDEAIGRVDGTGRSSRGWTEDGGPTLMEKIENDNLSKYLSIHLFTHRICLFSIRLGR
jgi:hypothetical protein